MFFGSHLVAVCFTAWLNVNAEAFLFDLPANTQRCFTHELISMVPVNISYVLMPGYGQEIEVKISDPNSKVLYMQRETDRLNIQLEADVWDHGKGPKPKTSIVGQYLLPGMWAVCFASTMTPGVPIAPGMKRMVSFRIFYDDISNNNPYDDDMEENGGKEVASKEKHLKPIEMRLRSMEHTTRLLNQEYEYFISREHELRDTNEHMNTKVMIINCIGIALFIAFAYWQAKHLKKHFKKRRLLE